MEPLQNLSTFFIETWVVWTFIVFLVITEYLSNIKYQRDQKRRRDAFYEEQERREIEEAILEMNTEVNNEPWENIKW